MSESPKRLTMARLIMRCATETGVSSDIARGVLFRDYPINSEPRDKAYRWLMTNRELVDTVRAQYLIKRTTKKAFEIAKEGLQRVETEQKALQKEETQAEDAELPEGWREILRLVRLADEKANRS